MALTTEAKNFREKVKAIVVNNLAAAAALPVDPETVYKFTIFAYFEKLENPGWFERWDEDKFYTKDILWPKKSRKRGQVRFKKGELKAGAGERKAATRYKILDYDNRIKFLQDCVAKAVGIPDDCQVFHGEQAKLEDPDNPRAEVIITVVDRDRYFPERNGHGDT